MTALWVILMILLAFWLIGLIRLKGFVEYSEEGVLVQIRVLWFRITLFPSPPKKKKPEKPEKKVQKTKKAEARKPPRGKPEGEEAGGEKPKEAGAGGEKTGEEKPEEGESGGERPEEEKIEGVKPEEEKPGKKKPKEKKAKDERPLTEKIGGLWSIFKEALPMVCEMAGKLFHKLRMEEITLHLTWAAEDPADAALGYGVGQAALGAVWPLLDRTFDIRRRDVGVAVDFTRAAPVVYARAILSFSLGQLVGLGLIYGLRGLGLLLRHRPKRKGKRRSEQKTGGGSKSRSGGIE